MIAARSSPRSARRVGAGSRAGFTLIEVIAAMALVMLLVGGIYSIAAGALELGRSTSEARLADLRVSNLVGLWRRQFETLPPAASLRTEPGDSGRWLVMEGTGSLSAWNPDRAPAELISFGIDGGELVLEQWNGASRSARLPLIPGVEYCDWEFYDAIERRWIAGEWPHPGRRPQLAAVTFQLARDPGAQRHVFRVAPSPVVITEGRAS